MSLRIPLTLVMLALLLTAGGRADEPQPVAAKKSTAAQAASGSPNAKKKLRPIQALLVTGGCCHDYERQKQILAKGIAARTDIVWTIAHQGGRSTSAKIPLYRDPQWFKGFDVVVHNECFANVRDKQWVERILKPHRKGLPAVLIHCAMHCYRTGDDAWFRFCGVTSPRHGAHYAFNVRNRAADHPIMQAFGKQWMVPKGELYFSAKLWPTATALADAPRRGDNEPQICVWTNQYEKGRVFATTIGHYNETMAEPRYLDLVTRGLLWSVDRLKNTDSFRATDEKTNAAIRKLATATKSPVKGGGKAKPEGPTRCCGEGNLAFGKRTEASTEEKNKRNFATGAVDGDLRTRWCASSARAPESWTVDLEKPQTVGSIRIHWEKARTAYRYRVEGSLDKKEWRTLVDQSKNKKRKRRIAGHPVKGSDPVRYLRVVFLGSSSGVWGSFWEFEAYAGKLPPLPKSLLTSAQSKPQLADVKAPEGFEVRMFAEPPQVNYPVCLAAAPTGEVFVGVDLQGSLGKKPGQGKVLRCLDVDGDGRADKINVFAKMDHPRGLIYDRGALWVLHPPELSVFHDDDLDGVADRKTTLITGITTDQLNKRGADHTTNGIRMGIDGWIYIAVGDFGFVAAKGADGTTLGRRGGGVLRVRPDGTEMEVFAWGLRNIVDVCVDPRLNVFTRDNTNDGGGWDIRVSHILQSGRYGYPSLYKNFAKEILPPLADYGGGSGCGAMYFQDLRWPAPFGDALYTCDWGRSEVYRHNLPLKGATFAPHQEVFLKIPRPTDMDADGSGRMYVSSWKNGKFNYGGPNVGFVAQVVPRDFTPKPFPDLEAETSARLITLLRSPSAATRLHVQRELQRRGPAPATRAGLLALAKSDVAHEVRLAAVFTLKQLVGADCHKDLLELSKQGPLNEIALRALTDRKTQLKGVPLQPFVEALRSKNPRVQAQALQSLGRLGDATAAAAVLPLTSRSPKHKWPTATPLHKQPDPARILPHLAVRTLVQLNAVKACVQALSGSHAQGALEALRQMHEKAAVDGIIQQLNKTRESLPRRRLLVALMRLHWKEGKYGGDWWGTRPDTHGPYYDPQPWPQTARIARVLTTAAGDADQATRQFFQRELERHQVKLKGFTLKSASAAPEKQAPIVVPKADPNNKNLIANLPFDAVARRASGTGDAERGRQLFQRQSCIACHTYADGQTPKGPHLVDIGKRYKRRELIESVVKPSAKIAQGFDTYSFATAEGKVLTGFIVGQTAKTIQLRLQNGLAVTLLKEDIEQQKKQPQSMMPEGLVYNLTPEQLADLLTYLESLRSGG